MTLFYVMEYIEVKKLIVGSCQMEVFIFESSSLKEKRKVIKSIIGRVQARFNVSIGEVGFHDNWKRAVIGFACVSNSSKHSNEVLDNVIKFIYEDSRIEVVSEKIEIM